MGQRKLNEFGSSIGFSKDKAEKAKIEGEILLKKELEKKVNPKSIGEGISKIVESISNNDDSSLLNPMKEASEEFKSKTGRNMT